MKHLATRDFWEHYKHLPAHIRELAGKTFEIMKADPDYPSLHFRKIGGLWSVRVGLHYRALGLDKGESIIWFWVGTHAEYDKLLQRE